MNYPNSTMSNITLNNNKKYKLHFDFQALTIFEEYSNYSISQLTEALSSLTGLNILIYSGLQKYHSDEINSPQELNKLLDLSQLESLITQVSTILKEAFQPPHN